MELAIESWSPEYGTPVETAAAETPAAQVDVEAEAAIDRWGPLGEGGRPAARVDFVDGVRRVEARIWAADGDGASRLGICASYAAGRVRCERRATVASVRVERGYFGPTGIPDLATPVGAFAARPTASDDVEQLIAGLQERMAALEVLVAEGAGADRAGPSGSTERADLVVLDGPLRGRQPVRGAVGYVKSHHVHYLPAELRRVVASLEPGRRTPIFLIQTPRTRYSWYMRLARAEGHPWAGVVRLESWPEARLEGARALADRAAATLPRFASEPHRDERAPQNLYPIAGLERELRRRLGDRGLVYRGLQRAVADGQRREPAR